MGKVEAKKEAIIERLVGYLLTEGLSQTGLRKLAAVSGTSDRMLIYYFGSKEGVLNEVLGVIAAQVTAQFDGLLGTEPRPGDELLAQLTALIMDDAFEPAVQLWFELVGLAVRGQEPYASNARLVADNYIEWIKSRLEDPEGHDPGDLYAHLEGRLMLKLIWGADSAD